VKNVLFVGEMTGIQHLFLPDSKKLTWKNYSLWIHKILTIGEYRDLDQMILCKEQRLDCDPEDYDKCHKEALMLMKLSVSDTLVAEVKNAIVAL
ncbi:hypothetical protein KI387_000507, partial [Taxus chinensis]